MDNIRQALERARARNFEGAGRGGYVPSEPLAYQFGREPPIEANLNDRSLKTTLVASHLEVNRIVAHDDTDFRSKSFDILRTQVLQAMDQKNWRTIGITSPTPGCGKTVVAVNLALSIARQPERSVLLVDLDLRKPQVASTMGLRCKSGVFDVLQGRTNLSTAVVHADAGSCSIAVLPAETAASDSAAWMVSRELVTVLQDIKSDYPSHTVILDLPPMLPSDDVIAVLPQLDCVLLVAAVGKSKVSEIEACNRHLEATHVVRLVLNKVAELNAQDYSYYASRSDSAVR